MLRSGRQRYVAQRNVNKARPLLWFRKIKTHVQTACEFHDLNMGFVVSTRLLAHLSIASNSYVHRILCKKTSWRCMDVEPTLYKRHVPAGLCVKTLWMKRNSVEPAQTLVIGSFWSGSVRFAPNTRGKYGSYGSHGIILRTLPGGHMTLVQRYINVDTTSHDVASTLMRRCINSMTLHRRWFDIV